MQINFNTFIKAINETKLFDSFEEAEEKGFLVRFKDQKGYAVQVDTVNWEWVEVHLTDNGVKHWGSK